MSEDEADRGTRPAWLLFWNGLAALAVMTILIAAQVTPPPVAQGVPFAVGVSILGLLVLGVGNLAVFAWQVLSADAGTASHPAASLRQGMQDVREVAINVAHLVHIGA